MESSWLVQRLQRPLRAPRSGPFRDNPFVFGGGLKNGGLSDDAMSLIRGIFQFDYMGASEYEWGAVPEALNRIANAATEGNLSAAVITVPLSEVPLPWRAPKDTPPPSPDETALIYVLAPSPFLTEATARIFGWATSCPSDPGVRDRLGLSNALRPHDDFDTRNQGWLELDNGFMFFTDPDMFHATAALFGIETETKETTK